MATEPREMEDLAKISGALLVNIGTLRGECLDGMKKGGMPMIVTYPSFPSNSSLPGFFANQFRKPIVFDPVGVGASAFRQETVNGTVSLGMNFYVVNRLMLEPKNS